MGNLILCHDRHAAHPYEITRIHSRIFTIEELCYYLCNNLYLIDYTIMNEQLCDWLDEELGMEELAAAFEDAKKVKDRPVLFDIKVLPKTMTDGYGSWWRVGDTEVSERPENLAAYQDHLDHVRDARKY